MTGSGWVRLQNLPAWRHASIWGFHLSCRTAADNVAATGGGTRLTHGPVRHHQPAMSAHPQAICRTFSTLLCRRSQRLFILVGYVPTVRSGAGCEKFRAVSLDAARLVPPTPVNPSGFELARILLDVGQANTDE